MDLDFGGDKFETVIGTIFFFFGKKRGSEGNSFTFYDWELEFGNFQELVGVRVTV